jgi:hypothetical protein
MPSRTDLRELASNVKEAFADADRETLLDVLTFVVKEYVVEGPPPMLIHQAETLSDLRGQSFAQLITTLQTRLEHPELAMFVVDGDQVGVRIGGVVHALLPSRQPAPQPQGGTAADLPRPPGVRVVETTLQPRPQPAPQAQPAAPGAQSAPRAAQPAPTAPPPARGLSIRGQPGAPPAPQSAQGQPPAGQGQPPAGQAAAQPPAGSSAVPSEKPESSGDDASARFSLLELD